MRISSACAVCVLAGAAAFSVAGTLPEYEIYEIDIVNAGDFGSQGVAVSPNGIATGRSLGSVSQAYRWTVDGGLEPLPNLASPQRDFSQGNGVNSAGVIVGTGAQTSFGSGPLPLIWTGGSVAQLPLPVGESLGRANDINDAGVAVGSADGGSLEVAVIYGETSEVITATTPGGAWMRTAFGINNSGLVVGNGIDPNNAARNVGVVYDSAAGTATEVGALPGRNGALAFAVSDAGHVVGSTMLNQGSGVPYIWTAAGGIQEVPLPAGTSQGGARGVNSAGWVVGTASNAFAIPFVFDGAETHQVSDLVPAGTGWDLSTNTSSSALGISDDGVIVGTGVLNGEVRGYALVPVSGGCNDADIAEPFGVLDLADVQGFIAAFLAGEPAADIAPPAGVFDLADLQAFIAAFVGGCP